VLENLASLSKYGVFHTSLIRRNNDPFLEHHDRQTDKIILNEEGKEGFNKIKGPPPHQPT